MQKTLKVETKQHTAGWVLLAASIIAVALSAFLWINYAGATITSQLDIGDSGAEVTELQTYLSSDVNLYPSKLITGYYGSLTAAGVKRFQIQEGIVSSGTPATTGYGRVGPKTAAALNAHLNQSDPYAPYVKNVNISTGSNSATVTWTASEAARGKVYYSTTPIRISNIFDVTGVFSGEPTVSGTLASYDGIAHQSQTVIINGLSSNTTYYYLVVVFDASNNASITLPNSFRTN